MFHIGFVRESDAETKGVAEQTVCFLNESDCAVVVWSVPVGASRGLCVEGGGAVGKAMHE